MIGDTINSIVNQAGDVLSDTRVVTALGVLLAIYALNTLGDDSFKIGGTASLFLDKED